LRHLTTPPFGRHINLNIPSSHFIQFLLSFSTSLFSTNPF
jgi:hypothetical protein